MDVVHRRQRDVRANAVHQLHPLDNADPLLRELVLRMHQRLVKRARGVPNVLGKDVRAHEQISMGIVPAKKPLVVATAVAVAIAIAVGVAAGVGKGVEVEEVEVVVEVAALVVIVVIVVLVVAVVVVVVVVVEVVVAIVVIGRRSSVVCRRSSVVGGRKIENHSQVVVVAVRATL